MKQTKQTKPEGVRSFQAVGERVLPIFYRSEITRIRADSTMDYIWEDVPYESKHHIEMALKNKEIKEV